MANIQMLRTDTGDGISYIVLTRTNLGPVMSELLSAFDVTMEGILMDEQMGPLTTDYANGAVFRMRNEILNKHGIDPDELLAELRRRCSDKWVMQHDLFWILEV